MFGYLATAKEQVMRVKRGHVVLTRGQEQPYKVILEYEWGEHSEHPVTTIMEGEALIRSRVCPPAPHEVEKLRQSPEPAPGPRLEAAARLLKLVDGGQS
jgi:hypothetical protein